MSVPQEADNSLAGLALVVSPQGRLHVGESAEPDAMTLSAATARRVLQAFSTGPSNGLLHLATGELQSPLPPALDYVRDLAKHYLTALCHASGSNVPTDPAAIEPPPRDELAFRVFQAPPMKGLEYVSADMLRDWWLALDEFVRGEISGCKGGAATYLWEKNRLWRMVGRVTFHLAENKRDEQFPFAFNPVAGPDQLGDPRITACASRQKRPNDAQSPRLAKDSVKLPASGCAISMDRATAARCPSDQPSPRL